MTDAAADVGRDRTTRILVVCTANLCRSPLVAALLRHELAAAGIDAEVASVGLDATPGARPDRRLRRVAGELGLDVAGHRSRPVSGEELRRADLILTMTGEQSDQVLALDPSTAGRIVTLRAAVWRAGVVAGRPVPFAQWVSRLVDAGRDADASRPDPAHDIADPTGGPGRAYRAMADEVSSLVRVLVERWSGR